MEEIIKKSYNPFKMWGSWIGGVIFMGSWIYSNFGCIKHCIRENLFPENCISYIGGCRGNLSDIIILITFAVIGFLLGWGIHSLVRKLKG